MRHITLFLIIFLMLGLPACQISCNGVSEDNTVLDGYRLNHTGEIELNESYTGNLLELSGGVAGMELNGVTEPRARILVKYKEYEPSDAIITLSEGKIKTESKSGKPVLLTSITGTIPNNLNLNIETGTGSVKLSDMQRVSMLNIETGTGRVDLRNIQSKALNLDTGTGSVNLDKCVAVTAEINTGTGSINLKDSYIESAEVESGTGGLYLKNSTIVKQDFDSSTGKIHQDGEYQAIK
ncbi:MAG: DUF4097 family beta strand repeat-containing protein [Candidatus Cloacimonetes bacterium]|nr:DUF4097 family beta strand repeat-containing protein [Candidatus Cloacimonadota bacterium]MDD3097536.1 DUF4097 family beta strand repeat-containing protein [Candidatus Cloacimonadota bacterium]